MCKLDNNEYQAVLIAPLFRGLFEPDTVVFYGNPAQIMRLSQAVVHACGKRIAGSFGGKVECTEYLVAPFRTAAARIAIPGLGDRIFSATTVFFFRHRKLGNLSSAVKNTNRK